MRKFPVTAFLAFLSVSIFPIKAYSWDYSEYQEKIKTMQKGELWDEFHKNLNASDKSKAYEAYLLYRPFDNFDSKGLLEEYEKKFGTQDYSKDDLSIKQDQEEASVYQAYLEFRDRLKKSKNHVVFSHSIVDFSKATKASIDEQVTKTKEMVAETKTCIRSFFKNNSSPCTISTQLKGLPGIVLLSKDDYDRFFNKNDDKEWEAFQKNYPDANGYFRFSRVGFDQGFQRAFFQVHVQPKLDGGFGEFVYFEKINGKWMHISKKGLYIY